MLMVEPMMGETMMGETLMAEIRCNYQKYKKRRRICLHAGLDSRRKCRFDLA